MSGLISKLRMRLLEQPLPDYKVAAVVGIVPARISEYANMKRTIPMKHLIVLCEFLNCSPEEVLGLEEFQKDEDGYTDMPDFLVDSLEPIDLDAESHA